MYRLGPGEGKFFGAPTGQQKATVMYISDSVVFMFSFVSNMLFYYVLDVENGNNLLPNAGIV